LGWAGYNNQSGMLPGDYESTFDSFDQVTPGGPAYFAGPNAEAA
jgi:hypothetical protein